MQHDVGGWSAWWSWPPTVCLLVCLYVGFYLLAHLFVNTPTALIGTCPSPPPSPSPSPPPPPALLTCPLSPPHRSPLPRWGRRAASSCHHAGPELSASHRYHGPTLRDAPRNRGRRRRLRAVSPGRGGGQPGRQRGQQAAGDGPAAAGSDRGHVHGPDAQPAGSVRVAGGARHWGVRGAGLMGVRLHACLLGRTIYIYLTRCSRVTSLLLLLLLLTRCSCLQLSLYIR